MHVPNHQAEEKYGERALPYKGRLPSCRPPLPGVFHLIDTAFASSDSHRSLLKKNGLATFLIAFAKHLGLIRSQTPLVSTKST